MIAVALSIGEPPQRKYSGSFAKNRTVCGVRKGAAIARDGHRRRFRKAHIHEDVVERIGAPGQNKIRLAEPQLLRGDAQRCQRTRTSRIGRAIHSGKIEPIGNPAGNDIAEETRKSAFAPLREMTSNAVASGLRLKFAHPLFA